MLIANLMEKQRLCRKFNVLTPEGVFEVVYNGEGIGYEEILVDDEIAARVNSLLCYVPQFEFMIGGRPAKVEVSVSLFMKISRFSLSISNECLYSE